MFTIPASRNLAVHNGEYLFYSESSYVFKWPEFTVLFLDLASQLSTAVAPHLPIDFEVGAPSLPMKVINSKINFGILRYPKKDIHISVCGSKLIPNRMPYKICYKYGSLAAFSVPTLHFLRHLFSQTNFMTWNFRTTKDLESCSQ